MSEELKEIIKSETTEEIEEIVLGKFHQIKHTESFGVLLRRLREKEEEISQKDKKIWKLECKICGLENKIKAVLGKVINRIDSLKETNLFEDIGTSDRNMVIKRIVKEIEQMKE